MVKEPLHKFQYHLCKMFGKLPSDSFFEEMDPVEKLWLYESWENEIIEDLKKERAMAILVGSFSNPEAAEKMYMKENPEFNISDEEFERQIQEQQERIAAEEKPKAKRKAKRRAKRTVIK